MRRSILFWLVAMSIAGSASAQGGRGDVNVEPQALQHYSYCVVKAKDDGAVYRLDRETVYRCHGEIAVSYFNFLGRRGSADQRVEEYNGVFLYRTISGGIGRCWNKIADEAMRPVSDYGCDIHIEL